MSLKNVAQVFLFVGVIGLLTYTYRNRQYFGGNFNFFIKLRKVSWIVLLIGIVLLVVAHT